MKIDLQDEALKTLEAFATNHCDGRENDEVLEAFVYLASRCVLAAAELLDAMEPDHPHCAVCRTANDVKEIAHKVAVLSEAKELAH
jgi:hypothetical protein